MADSLPLGNSGNPFGSHPLLDGFDSAGGYGDLSGFDAATGRTTVPPGKYVLRVERGELTTTRAGKTAYRLRFAVVEPGEYAGFTLWRTLLLDTPAALNRAKNWLMPLGITTADDLRSTYPPIAREVYVRAIVTIRPARDGYPESSDVERVELCDAPASSPSAVLNPYAVDLGNTGEGAKE